MGSQIGKVYSNAARARVHGKGRGRSIKAYRASKSRFKISKPRRTPTPSRPAGRSSIVAVPNAQAFFQPPAVKTVRPDGSVEEVRQSAAPKNPVNRRVIPRPEAKTEPLHQAPPAKPRNNVQTIPPNQIVEESPHDLPNPDSDFAAVYKAGLAQGLPVFPFDQNKAAPPATPAVVAAPSRKDSSRTLITLPVAGWRGFLRGIDFLARISRIDQATRPLQEKLDKAYARYTASRRQQPDLPIVPPGTLQSNQAQPPLELPSTNEFQDSPNQAESEEALSVDEGVSRVLRALAELTPPPVAELPPERRQEFKPGATAVFPAIAQPDVAKTQRVNMGSRDDLPTPVETDVSGRADIERDSDEPVAWENNRIITYDEFVLMMIHAFSPLTDEVNPELLGCVSQVLVPHWKEFAQSEKTDEQIIQAALSEKGLELLTWFLKGYSHFGVKGFLNEDKVKTALQKIQKSLSKEKSPE